MIVFQKDNKLNINILDGKTDKSQVVIEEDNGQAKISINDGGSARSGEGSSPYDIFIDMCVIVTSLDPDVSPIGQIDNSDTHVTYYKTLDEIKEKVNAGEVFVGAAVARMKLEGSDEVQGVGCSILEVCPEYTTGHTTCFHSGFNAPLSAFIYIHSNGNVSFYPEE